MSTDPPASPARQRLMAPLDGDLVRSYLRDIGRVPLLSHEQEITLGRQVQELMGLEELREELALRAGGEP
ncbi:MAG: sigma-70 factor domain-containing protein, partial [Cyanobacteriota bacterium]